MIRIFSHYVSRMAFVLLLLELLELLFHLVPAIHFASRGSLVFVLGGDGQQRGLARQQHGGRYATRLAGHGYAAGDGELVDAELAAGCEDGGPVLYQQQRVGINGRLFHVLKFRSMRIDAKPGGQPVWAAAAYPRVTRGGHWLRKLRIDELPQMLNVFRGAMSFVGPRPERAFFVERLGREVPYYNVRHSIKPGVTGLAQVHYQYGDSVDDAVRKLQYDLYYVKNNSLFLDLLILLDTVQVVLFGKGSR